MSLHYQISPRTKSKIKEPDDYDSINDADKGSHRDAIKAAVCTRSERSGYIDTGKWRDSYRDTINA